VDKRDGQTWVALELTHLGEQRAEDGSLEAALRRELGVDDEWPVFVPSMSYVKDGKKTTLHLMEGYAFVGSGLPEVQYFSLERKSNVAQVLSVRGSRGLRALSVLPDRKIEEIRNNMRSLQAEALPIGSRVLIVDGTFSALTGELVALEGDTFFVHIVLRSLNIIATVPRNMVELEGGQNG